MQFDASAHNGAGNGLRLQLAFQDVDYDDQPGFFLGFDRADHIVSATIEGEIRDWPASRMNLLPKISWVSNGSNIPLYEYERLEVGLTLQRSF